MKRFWTWYERSPFGEVLTLVLGLVLMTLLTWPGRGLTGIHVVGVLATLVVVGTGMLRVLTK